MNVKVLRQPKISSPTLTLFWIDHADALVLSKTSRFLIKFPLSRGGGVVIAGVVVAGGAVVVALGVVVAGGAVVVALGVVVVAGGAVVVILGVVVVAGGVVVATGS